MPKAVNPFLLTKTDDGLVRVTIRTTRFNSQGYPLVTSELLEQGFPSAFKARAYLRDQYRAAAGDISIG